MASRHGRLTPIDLQFNLSIANSHITTIIVFCNNSWKQMPIVVTVGTQRIEGMASSSQSSININIERC